MAATFQEQASAEGSDDLGQADGAVEEPEEGTHLAAAFDGIGEEGEGQCEHGCPRCADEGVTQPKDIGVVYPEDGDEADTADDEREDVGTFVAYLMLNGREEGCPDEGADSLYGEAYAHPVACVLESTCGGVHTIPAEALGSDGTVGVGPHIHEGCPAEELHETDCQESEDDTLVVVLAVGFGGVLFDTVELSVLFGVHLTNVGEGIKHAEDKDGGTDVETPLDRVGNDAVGSGIGETNPCEEDREEVAYE